MRDPRRIRQCRFMQASLATVSAMSLGGQVSTSERICPFPLLLQPTEELGVFRMEKNLSFRCGHVFFFLCARTSKFILSQMKSTPTVMKEEPQFEEISDVIVHQLTLREHRSHLSFIAAITCRASLSQDIDQELRDQICLRKARC